MVKLPKKSNVLIILSVLELILLVGYAAFIICISFSNPDMTGTRLLITYWRWYVSFLAPILIIGFIVHKNK